MRAPIILASCLAVALSTVPPEAAIADPVTDAAGYSHSGTHTYLVEEIGASFASISLTGANLTALIGDDGETDVSIGFTFDFLGGSFSDVQVNGNGHVHPGTGYDPAANYQNGANPNSAHPEGNGGSIPANYDGPVIAIGWDDLDVTAGGGIYSATRGIAPNREFVVEYAGVQLFGGSSPQTLQLVLRETSNEIVMLYPTHDAERNGVAVGIQFDDQTYLQYGYFASTTTSGFPESGEALRFSPTGGGGTNPFGGKHVLVVGIDGVRSDAVQTANTPAMDALIAVGAVTWDAFAGGLPVGPTNQATSSGPGWSSICTAVWVNKHGVADNSFSGSNFGAYPHFFERIKEGSPGAFLSSIVQWHPINGQIVSAADFKSNTTDSTQAVEDAATAHLSSANPDVLFLHFDDVDHAGHGSGFSPANPAYISAIETVDTAIGNVITAIENRPGFSMEDWLVVITTDHGGSGTSHGGQSADERTIWIIASGGASCGGEILVGPGHTAVPPTVFEHLGLTIDPAWEWEDEAFGLAGCVSNAAASDPTPPDGSPAESIQASLSWEAGVGAITHDIYFGTDSTPDAGEFSGNQTETVFDPGLLVPATTYYWRIDEVGTEETVVGNVWSFNTAASIDGDLVLHLPFDNDTLDVSGRDNHGTAVGGPSFVPGRIGTALDLDGTGPYVTLGAPPDLDFGADTDFTVALWIKTDQLSSDPSIVSNKDWLSGSNTGWVVAAQSDGIRWQWNYKGTASGRRDFENGGTITDDAWHHVAVTHDRDGVATYFHDGSPIGSVSIASSGTTDSGLNVAIGQDGTLSYGANLDAALDDVGIWRRRLGGSEVRELFNKGRAGLPLDASAEGLVPGTIDGQLLLARSSSVPGDVVLSWPASCSSGPTDYAVYEGTLGDFYSHTQRVCSDAAGDRMTELTPAPGNRYFLVVSMDQVSEGSYGTALEQGGSVERPRPVETADRCRPTQDTTPCVP